MFVLTLLLLLLALTLAGALYALSLFLQGWVYTEPTPGMAWRAPALAAGMTLFYVLWCFLNISAGASPTVLPYDTVLRYSPEVALTKSPAEQITAFYKNGKSVVYQRQNRTRDQIEYVQRSNPTRTWDPIGVEALEVVVGGERYRFQKREAREGTAATYYNDMGWTMVEYGGAGGPTGMAVRSQTGRTLANWLLNLMHGLLWFAGFWVLLRFEWLHALGLAAAFWVIMTVGVLPFLLGRAGEVSATSTVSLRLLSAMC